ncbi:hypothetical protein [Burkholderia stagnalis]|uniref:hypothetical protein n=1 Tax=Burkholderia stagnalis TaxID=1503054 RepID=UPI000F5999B8|nr:hypothetical protein [Burkholderia stagnalis]
MVTTDERIRHYLTSSKALPYLVACVPNKAMLTGKELGDALRIAIKKKAVTQKAVADHFGVKPPSVQDWINFGRIGKKHLNELVAYFADVVPPEHWGLAPIDLVYTDSEGRLTVVQAKNGVGTSTDDHRVSPGATLSVIEMSERLAAQIVAVTRAGLLDERGIALLEREMRRCVAAMQPTTENDASGKLSDLEAPERNAQHGRRGHGRQRPK